MKLDILYKDKDILVVRKPAFVASTEERGNAIDMVSAIKNYYAANENKMTDVYAVHRLDKPVEGIMVYALSKNAATKLSKDVAQGNFNKYYYAILTNIPQIKQIEKKGINDVKTINSENDYKNINENVLCDYLVKDGRSNISKVVKENTPNAKKALLKYEIIEEKEIDSRKLYLARVKLLTGRHHQIRVQFANADAPLYGDKKYGNNDKTIEKEGVALCSYKLEFAHPVLNKKMEFEITPENSIFRRFFND